MPADNANISSMKEEIRNLTHDVSAIKEDVEDIAIKVGVIEQQDISGRLLKVEANADCAEEIKASVLHLQKSMLIFILICILALNMFGIPLFNTVIQWFMNI